MTALEEALGVKLFERRAHGYRLTQAGEAVLPLAETLERAALAIDAQARAQSRAQGGTVRITTEEVFAVTLLMAVLHWLGVGHAEGAHTPLRVPGLWITFFALVLPVWAGAVHAITAQLELERVAERSERMVAALTIACQRASGAVTHEELAAAAQDAAGLMLRETHEWWVLLSFQDARLHV